MSDVRAARMAKQKRESREISKKIIDFGVSEEQKIDVMFNLAMTLENNEAMKEITSVLKKFIEKFNKEEDSDDNSKRLIIT